MKKIDTYDGSERLANVRQEAFAQAYVFFPDDKGKFYNASNAYRQAGYKVTSDESCRVCASKLLTNANVQARVQFLIDLTDKQLMREGLKFRRKNLQRLDDIADSDSMNGMIKVAAIREMNAMLGFKAPERHELTGANGTPLVRSEAELEKEYEELKRMLEKC